MRASRPTLAADTNDDLEEQKNIRLRSAEGGGRGMEGGERKSGSDLEECRTVCTNNGRKKKANL